MGVVIMALKEISLAEVLDKTSGTSYFTAFVQLVGKTSDLVLYKGIDETYAPLIEELEDQLGAEINESYSICPESYSEGFGNYYYFTALDENLFKSFMLGQITIEQLLEQNQKNEEEMKKEK